VYSLADGGTVGGRSPVMAIHWFEWYGGDAAAVAGANKLKSLASIAQLGKTKGEQPLPENEGVEVTQVVEISAGGATLDREFSSDEILRS
jgi:hypothetical protein